MCGIAGWIDFERDLERERATANAMTGTMALRGPDDEGLWLGRHAALGNRRLAVIDLHSGHMPIVAEEGGEPVAVITYSGEAYNFRELRAELQARGHSFRTSGDTEVVLHAYLEWGDDCVTRLNGMFAFAIWDVRSERLLLARDRLGVKPLYYEPTNSGVLFGSEPKALLANALAEPVIDADGLRQILGFVRTPGLVPFKGMREVRPGHVVVVDRKGARERPYWKFEARPHLDSVEVTVQTIRGLLEDIVTRQLFSDVPLCTLLSGGLDSSAITALAARVADGAGPVRSFSVDFVGYTENFKPNPLNETPDTPYVRDVVAHVGTDHSEIVLDSAQLLDSEVRREVLHAWDLPTAMGDLDTSLYLLFRAIRERSTVALTGESADELFGGYRWFHEPEAVNAGTFPWMAIMGTMGMTRPLFDAGLMAELDLPTYIADRYRDALAEVPHLPDEDPVERRMREVSHLHLTRFLPMLLDRKDRMSMAVGLEVRVPFCDHRLMEYVFNTPWSMKTFDGREKSLLRAATRDLLPATVAERRKSPYPATQDHAYGLALLSELGGVLNEPSAPVLPLLDTEVCEELVEVPPDEATLQMERMRVDSVLRLNRWLNEYGVRIAS